MCVSTCPTFPTAIGIQVPIPYLINVFWLYRQALLQTS